MGRSRGGLIVAPSHIKMNKLLLALATGSSEEGNQVERFEAGLAREAREANPVKDNGRTRPRIRTSPRGRTSPRKRTSRRRRTKIRGRTRRARREGLTRGRD